MIPLLIVVYTFQIQFVIASQKYPCISEYKLYSRSSSPEIDSTTFICKSDHEQSISMGWSKILKVGTMDFENCHFPVMPKLKGIFGMFYNMHTLIISNVDLEKISTDAFEKATNITDFLVAENRLKEIPALLFVTAHKIRKMDFSKNAINRIDSFAFVGLNNLEILNLSNNNLTTIDKIIFANESALQFLNLSHNHINELESNALEFPNLLELDLADNNLSTLDGHVFDKLSHLRQLNLSFNPISEITNETFAALFQLRHLNLKQLNISSIAMGAFSHQQKLITLDLSGNLLKILDFQLFHPIQHDLTTLRLANNQLTELEDFRSSLFLQPLVLDIQSNDFSCSYLEYFLESVNWTKIQLPTNQYLMEKPSIRQINCNVPTYPSIYDIIIQFHVQSNLKGNTAEITDLKRTATPYIFLFVFIFMFVILICACFAKNNDKYVVQHSTLPQ